MKSITCKELIDFLDDYVEARLTNAQRLEFEHHLEVCPSCVRFVQSYRETIRLSKGAYSDAEASIPTDVPHELVKAILMARQR